MYEHVDASLHPLAVHLTESIAVAFWVGGGAEGGEGWSVKGEGGVSESHRCVGGPQAIGCWMGRSPRVWSLLGLWGSGRYPFWASENGHGPTPCCWTVFEVARVHWGAHGWRGPPCRFHPTMHTGLHQPDTYTPNPPLIRSTSSPRSRMQPSGRQPSPSPSSPRRPGRGTGAPAPPFPVKLRCVGSQGGGAQGSVMLLLVRGTGKEPC